MEKQKFEVYAVPCNRPFVISREEFEKGQKHKLNLNSERFQFIRQMEEEGHIIDNTGISRKKTLK